MNSSPSPISESGRARRAQSGAISGGRLFQAAATIVAEEGLAGLSLRPLAQKLGCSVSALSHQFGARDDILGVVIEAARANEMAFLARWRSRLEGVATLSASRAADVLDAILDDLVLNNRDGSILFLEFVQACAWEPALRGPIGGWLAERANFWSELGRLAGVPSSILEANLIQGLTVDELAYSCALSTWPAYRVLRKLSLNRFFDGFVQPSAGVADARLMAQVFDELDYKPSELSVVHGAPIVAGWQGRVAQAAAKLITSRGVSAVTHRAVAVQADVKPTTLAYRFPTQEDLVVGGLEFIISRLLRSVDPERPRGQDSAADQNLGFEIGRATFAIAITSTRMDRLKPCAADMRRQRGVNTNKLPAIQALSGRGVDFLSAQSMSVALIGLIMTLETEPDMRSERTKQAFEAAIAWMNAGASVSVAEG